jgi:hypothetical protein
MKTKGFYPYPSLKCAAGGISQLAKYDYIFYVAHMQHPRAVTLPGTDLSTLF